MTANQPSSRLRANEEFLRARREALLKRLWGNLTGQHDALVPFEDLKKRLGFYNQHYRGIQAVPLDKIIGSLGRSKDFDRAFLPTQTHSRGKWISVGSAFLSGVTLPPIQLYKVGDAYFVVDGHHRVSVARRQGLAFLDAEVTEVKSRVPVTRQLSVEDLDNLGAYRDFLEETKLDRLRPDQNVRLTMPGDYQKLLDHIRVHKYFVETAESREMALGEAVTDWYDNVYMPLVRAIRSNKLLTEFPGRTEGDLYLWIIEHAYYLSERMGWQVPLWEAAKDFAERFGKRPRRLWQRVRSYVTDRLVPDSLESGRRAGAWREERVEPEKREHLFHDILITLTGAESGWRALAQVAEIARFEQGTLDGLHVAASDDQEAMTHGDHVLQEFSSRSDDLGVSYTTTLAVGSVDETIVNYARWTDLVVINQRREHGRWAERPLGTIFHKVAEQASRPVLVVPGAEVRRLKRAVLAYDGSAKAREALFVFRHVLDCWGLEGTILTVDTPHTDHKMMQMAWEYVQAEVDGKVLTRYEQGAAHQVILNVMREDDADLLLMGGYGYQPLLKAFLGSTVDQVLREAWFPVLICR